MEQTIANVEIGSQVYLEEGDDPCGAVRDVAPSGRNEITRLRREFGRVHRQFGRNSCRARWQSYPRPSTFR